MDFFLIRHLMHSLWGSCTMVSANNFITMITMDNHNRWQTLQTETYHLSRLLYEQSEKEKEIELGHGH